MDVKEIINDLREEHGLIDVEVEYLAASYQYDLAAVSTSMDFSVAERRGEAWKALQAAKLPPDRIAWLHGVLAVLRYW